MPEHQVFSKVGHAHQLRQARSGVFQRSEMGANAAVERLLPNEGVRGNAQFFLNISFVIVLSRR